MEEEIKKVRNELFELRFQMKLTRDEEHMVMFKEREEELLSILKRLIREKISSDMEKGVRKK